MSELSDKDRAALLKRTSEIVSAYVSANEVAAEALPSVIETVFDSLRGLGQDADDLADMDKPVPAVPIADSLRDDALICLEDGLPFQSLKRHLRVKYNLTPEAYRKKWGLPADYPMVAPDYAKRRSALAKRTGLGKNRS